MLFIERNFAASFQIFNARMILSDERHVSLLSCARRAAWEQLFLHYFLFVNLQVHLKCSLASSNDWSFPD